MKWNVCPDDIYLGRSQHIYVKWVTKMVKKFENAQIKVASIISIRKFDVL